MVSLSHSMPVKLQHPRREESFDVAWHNISDEGIRIGAWSPQAYQPWTTGLIPQDAGYTGRH